MAYKNLIYQTTTGTGTGNLTLSAVTGWRDFATAFGTGAGNPFVYVIRHTSAAEYEVGTGYMSDATTLVRSAVVDSSNANAAVNFAAGTKDVWHAVPAADANNFVNQTLLDAKGDLIVASAADTAARLAVGTDGQVLAALSSESTGAKWQTLPLVVPVHATSSYYGAATANSSTGTMTTNQGRAVPFLVPSDGTYDRIAVEVTATAATSTVRLGIYAAGSDGLPGSLVLDAGTIDGSVSTGVKEITISQALTRGVVWLVAVSQTASPTLRLHGSSFWQWGWTDAATLSATGSVSSVFCTSLASGALPASFGTPTGFTTNAPRILLRRA